MIDEKIFPFLAEKGHVISLVGGGGKTTLMIQSGCDCGPQGLAGIGRYHHPYYAAAPAGSGHRRMQSFSACGSAAVMPWPEPLHPVAN